MTRSRSRDTAKAKDYAKAKEYDNGHYDHGHRDNYTMPRSRSRGKHKDYVRRDPATDDRGR